MKTTKPKFWFLVSFSKGRVGNYIKETLIKKTTYQNPGKKVFQHITILKVKHECSSGERTN